MPEKLYYVITETDPKFIETIVIGVASSPHEAAIMIHEYYGVTDFVQKDVNDSGIGFTTNIHGNHICVQYFQLNKL